MTFKHTIEHVKEFHKKFGHPVADKPTIPDAKTRLLRVKLIMEEAMEFAEASGFPCNVYFAPKPSVSYAVSYSMSIKDVVPEYDSPEKVDIIEAADALADIDYVVQGANLVWGFPAQEIMEEVQASNMSKLGKDGKPIYNDYGKIMKGPKYFAPNIKKIIDKLV
jgi:predicted HAD superfamily Cof-like phosphohydrolase